MYFNCNSSKCDYIVFAISENTKTNTWHMQYFPQVKFLSLYYLFMCVNVHD